MARKRYKPEEIVATAKEKGCDLIVMASHGRRGVSRLLLGSQAYVTRLFLADGSRIAGFFAAMRMSAFGTKRTSRDICFLSAFGGKADIGKQAGNVRS